MTSKILNFRKICAIYGNIFSNVIKFSSSNYCYIQNWFSFIHYFTRYGNFKFDIKRFCSFTLIFWLKIDVV